MSVVKRWRKSCPWPSACLFTNRAHFLGLLLLWLFACSLALLGLGDLPLRDFDEGTVARVAFELSQQKGAERLLPTLWNSPYLNKPPGLHWLIAFAIDICRTGSSDLFKPPSELAIRVVPALLSTLIVPVGGLIQFQLRPGDRLASFATSSILLTLMPIARHGRLAMLDGFQLSLIGVLWLFLLSIDCTHMDRWKALGAGLAGSFMLMLKAPLLLPAGLAAVIPIWWGGNLSRFNRMSLPAWIGLGLMPGLFWHLWNGLNRGAGALWLWGGDGAGRVLFDAGEGSDLGWMVPVIETIEGGWPWLLLWPFAVVWAWRQRKTLWGQWALSSQVVLALAILPLRTQLPWYSHPLWLPFSLLCGVPLAWLIRRERSFRPPGLELLVMVPSLLVIIGILVFSFGIMGASSLINELRPYSAIAIAVGAGWSFGGWFLSSSERNQRVGGAIALVGGSFVGLVFLMTSSLWLWELNETWPVETVTQLASKAHGSTLFIEGNHERPSLNWYAGKRIPELNDFANSEWILTRNPQRVIKRTAASLNECQSVAREDNWTLLSCGPKD